MNSHPLLWRREMTNRLMLLLSLIAMSFGLFWLIWILWSTVSLGWSGISWELFTQSTPAPNSTGGIANALMGSFMLVATATLIGAPLGIMAGIYLAEYGQTTWLARTTRFLNDILLSAPSIVIGLFVYALVVIPMQHFSGWAGLIALALLEIPIVVRTTENMLKLVPNQLREAAYALGTPKWRMILAISVKASLAGIITGVLLAISRVTGETAPLLFTNLSNQFWSLNLSQPIANLPVMIYQFALSPYENWQKLAWSGVLIITMSVLLLNIIARYISKRLR